MSYDVTILGGGWAGICSAYEIKKLNPNLNIVILEARSRNERGGLLRTEKVEGFSFDVGGPHMLFSRNDKILSEIISILGENVSLRSRMNFIYFNGKYISYPFENGISSLEPEMRVKFGFGIIQSMIKLAQNSGWRPNTFHDWMLGFFGESISREYLEPYNKKIWKKDPKELDADWVFVPGRLPNPELEEILKSVAGIESVGYKEQSKFYYPIQGGIQSLYDSLLNKLIDLGVRIKMSSTVKKIEKRGNTFTINDFFTTKRIVNTLPPISLTKILQMPPKIVNTVKKFEYNKVIIIGIALNTPSPPQHSVYIPDASIIFHRLTWMNNFVNKTPKGKSNLIAEVTVPSWEKVDVNFIQEQTLKGLFKIGIIDSKRDVLFSKLWINEFGYPIYVRGHSEIRREFYKYLEDTGIFSVGRWGSWHYWNTDKVLEAAKQEASRVVNSLPL